MDLEEAVRRLNDRFHTGLTLRAGIDSGQVSAGLVGNSTKVYELWGEALELAYQVHSATGEPGIFVSGRVHEVMNETYGFSAAGDVGGQPVFVLNPVQTS